MAGILQQAEQMQAPKPAAPPTPGPAPEQGMSTESMPPEESGPGEQSETPEQEGQEGDTPERIPGQEDASPEEQEQFERARAVGLKLLSAKGALDRLIDVVRKGGLMGIAEMIATMVARVDEKMDLPETVIMPLATELTGFVLDAVERSRAAKVDEKGAQQVLSAVYKSLAEVYGQTPADAKAAMDELEMGNGNPARSA